MPVKQKYRLQPLLIIKERAKRKSEFELSKAIREVEIEKKKLEKLVSIKKELIEKRTSTRKDMRNKIATGQAKVRQSEVHLRYIEKLKDDEVKLEQEINEQKEALDYAEKKLKRSRRDYMDAASELNTMEKHKELWEKKQKKELDALENKQMNELGNVVHQLGKMK